MLNIHQNVVRYTVGKITPIQRREVRSSDFGPRASFWMNFPKEGSQLTPPHQSEDFKWKDYCPMVFRLDARFTTFRFVMYTDRSSIDSFVRRAIGCKSICRYFQMLIHSYTRMQYILLDNFIHVKQLSKPIQLCIIYLISGVYVHFRGMQSFIWRCLPF